MQGLVDISNNMDEVPGEKCSLSGSFVNVNGKDFDSIFNNFNWAEHAGRHVNNWKHAIVNKRLINKMQVIP